MAVDQERGSDVEAGRHGQSIVGIEPNQDEAVPTGTVALGLGLECAEESLLELQDGQDLVGSNQGASRGNRRRGKQDILVLVGAGRNDGGSTVDLGGIEQVEDREVLDGENLVHALETEAALTV